MNNKYSFFIKHLILPILAKSFSEMPKTKITSLFKCVFNVADELTSETQNLKYTYYNQNLKVLQIEDSVLAQTMYNTLTSLPSKNFASLNNVNFIKLITVDNLEYYIYTYGSNDSPDHNYCIYMNKQNKLDEQVYIDKLIDLFFKQGNHTLSYSQSRQLIISKQKITDSQYKQEIFFDIKKYINDFNKKSKNRAIVLYGNPGTGKTILANQIMKDLDYKYIKFVNFMSIYDILPTVLLLKPDGIIIDDFDRTINSSAAMLSAMETLQQNVKLIIYTANDIDFIKKHKAIIRPGRIDEFFEINHLDKRIILQILGENNEDLFDKMKDFPIAFISECRNIIDVYGKQYLIDNLVKIKDRVLLNSDNSLKVESETHSIAEKEEESKLVCLYPSYDYDDYE